MKIIITIRNKEVILDKDLAELCQVKTKVLNQSIKRNIDLFSFNNRFQLNQEEKQEVVTNCDHLKSIQFSPNLPFVFTKEGIEIALKIMKKDISIDSLFSETQSPQLLVQNEDLRSKIYNIRGLQVMLDFDLAQLYQVETKRLNEQVKRNLERFPNRYRFQLNKFEFDELVANCDQLNHLKHSYNLPFAFTETGIAMLATVLNSEVAINTSLKIIDAFVDNKRIITNNANLLRRVDNLEQKQIESDIKHSETNSKLDRVLDIIEENEVKPKQAIFHQGQMFDSYNLVCRIIRSAKKSIILIDNYIDDSVLQLFTKRKDNVKTILYTQKISKTLKQDLEKHNSQYPKIEIKKVETFHDRFIVIDKKELYHIGASLEDLGKKCFALSKFNINPQKMLCPLKI